MSQCIHSKHRTQYIIADWATKFLHFCFSHFFPRTKMRIGVEADRPLLPRRVLARRLLLLILLASISVSVAKIDSESAPIGTTGSACTYNASCTGPNEYCNFLGNFDVPCQMGRCECLPCHSLNREGVCSKLNLLELGHACFREPNEVIVVENADCYLGVVSCHSGFTQTGNYCGDDGGYAFAAECESSYYCAGDMKCLNGTCGCIAGGSYKFDAAKNACVLKELGDSCDVDDDCQIAGTMWTGFTADKAACINGKCTCAPGSRDTLITYLNANSAQSTKRICIHANGSVALPAGSSCDVDPVIVGNLADVEACESGLVCIQCPEDSIATHKGKCKKLLQATQPPVCYQTIKEPGSPVAGENADVVTDRSSADVAVATRSWSWTDRMMASVANRTWYNNGWSYRQCSSSSQCSANEDCLIPDFCRRGVCACTPPNYQDNLQNCFASPNSAATTTQLPTSSLSNSENYSTSTAKQVVNDGQARLFSYGMVCTSVTDCGRIGLASSSPVVLNGLVQNGLHCLSNATDNPDRYCLCPPSKYKWDEPSARCVSKEFGDPCTSDADCDTGSYTKLSAGGFRCLLMAGSGTCGCSVDFLAVSVAIVPAAWGAVMPRNMAVALNRKTYCVNAKGHRGEAKLYGNCTVNVVESSDSLTYACDSGLVCLFCPADTTLGTCISLGSLVEPGNSDQSDASLNQAEQNGGLQLANPASALVTLSLTLFRIAGIPIGLLL